MCSGLRSSSANGAIAWRQASACSWSTSSRRVLSDWTMRGPSFITDQLYGPDLLGGLERQVLRTGAGGAQARDEQLDEFRGGCEGDVHVEVGGDGVELARALLRAAPAERQQPVDGGLVHLPGTAQRSGADALGGVEVLDPEHLDVAGGHRSCPSGEQAPLRQWVGRGFAEDQEVSLGQECEGAQQCVLHVLPGPEGHSS